jgi:hypothetical protein
VELGSGRGDAERETRRCTSAHARGHVVVVKVLLAVFLIRAPLSTSPTLPEDAGREGASRRAAGSPRTVKHRASSTAASMLLTAPMAMPLRMVGEVRSSKIPPPAVPTTPVTMVTSPKNSSMDRAPWKSFCVQ